MVTGVRGSTGRAVAAARIAKEMSANRVTKVVMLFKKRIVLATREGRNENGTFATYWSQLSHELR